VPVLQPEKIVHDCPHDRCCGRTKEASGRWREILIRHTREVNECLGGYGAICILYSAVILAEPFFRRSEVLALSGSVKGSRAYPASRVSRTATRPKGANLENIWCPAPPRLPHLWLDR
jgi:hypothetical protein